MAQNQNNLSLLDILTIASFFIGVYALYIALENLEENREQTNDTNEILHKLNEHLQDQDGHLFDIKDHLKTQDKLIIERR